MGFSDLVDRWRYRRLAGQPVMRTDGQQGILLNVVVGIVGAFLGGWLISPLVGVGTINEGISIGSVLVSLVGAVILLAIVNLFRRGRVR
jgi:uncharacterized membrane protein YeaQ/YmgE (transglycosylase-associated protein family)